MILWSLRTLIFSNGLSTTRISTLKLKNQNRKSPTKKLKGSLSFYLLSLNDQDINIETEEPKQEVPHQEVERV